MSRSTQQKHAFNSQKERTTTQNKQKTKNKRKTKPSLVAIYDIRPGNGAGLFSRPTNSTCDFYVMHNETFCLQCFDAVGWVAGRASGL